MRHEGTVRDISRKAQANDAQCFIKSCVVIGSQRSTRDARSPSCTNTQVRSHTITSWSPTYFLTPRTSVPAFLRTYVLVYIAYSRTCVSAHLPFYPRLTLLLIFYLPTYHIPHSQINQTIYFPFPYLPIVVPHTNSPCLVCLALSRPPIIYSST